MPAVSILIPTHNHQDTLVAAIASIQQQTVRDLEILIVGDGVPSRTRDIAQSLMQTDARIQFFDYPKSPRTGEIYRDELIRTVVTSPTICYLADDDLWLPQHVETMMQALQTVDFVHTLHTFVKEDASFLSLLFNLNSSWLRKLLTARSHNGFGLSFAAHTRKSYLMLPTGWETTPIGCPTDLYMWSKFIQADISCASLLFPTALHFKSADRQCDTPLMRSKELQRWLANMQHSSFIQDLCTTTHYDPGLLMHSLGDTKPNAIADFLELHKLHIKVVNTWEVNTWQEIPRSAINKSGYATVLMCNDPVKILETQFLSYTGQISSSRAKGRWINLCSRRPWDSSARLELARYFARDGDWEVVEELLMPPASPQCCAVEAIALYAEALSRQGKRDLAERVLRDRLRRSPHGAILLRKIAEIAENG